MPTPHAPGDFHTGHPYACRLAALATAALLAAGVAWAQETAPLPASSTAADSTGQVNPTCVSDPDPCASDDAATRLLFGPTGRTLRRGEGYVRVFNVLFPMFEVGVTDRFSFGGGTPLLPFAPFHPYWVTPKLQVHRTERVQSAVGLVHVGNIASDLQGLGVAYGVTTIGSHQRAVSIGAGYAYADGADGHDGAPVVLVGAERRVGRRCTFITENYIGPGIAFISVGERVTGRRIRADAGLGAVITPSGAFALPMVNVAWQFGAR